MCYSTAVPITTDEHREEIITKRISSGKKKTTHSFSIKQGGKIDVRINPSTEACTTENNKSTLSASTYKIDLHVFYLDCLKTIEKYVHFKSMENQNLYALNRKIS